MSEAFSAIIVQLLIIYICVKQCVHLLCTDINVIRTMILLWNMLFYSNINNEAANSPLLLSIIIK